MGVYSGHYVKPTTTFSGKMQSPSSVKQNASGYQASFIQKIPVSNLRVQTDYPKRGFSQLSLVPLSQC